MAAPGARKAPGGRSLIAGGPAAAAAAVAVPDRPPIAPRTVSRMRALTVSPGKADSLQVADVPDPMPGPGQVLVRGLAVGVCGTDREIAAAEHGQAPPGRDRLILGHESLGRVVCAPPGTGLAAGDLVVGVVRRPGPAPGATAARRGASAGPVVAGHGYDLAVSGSVTRPQIPPQPADPRPAGVRAPGAEPATAGGWHGPHGDELGQATAAWLAAKKPTTREAYARDLRAWGGFCAERGVHVLTARKPDADLFGAALQDPAAGGTPLSASSAARRMAAVSSWYRYLVACGLHERNPFAAAERPRVDRDYSATAWLDEAAARQIIEAAQAGTGATRLRDAAMVRLMLQLGVRVSEVCSLQIDALGAARGQRTVTVRGKGGKRIERALPPAAAEALDAYLAWRAQRAGVAPGSLTGPLFATASGRAVDRGEVFRLVRRLAERAGLPQPDAVTPHALRHTFATIATERGADLDDLQDAMGHADPRTTRRYQRAARRLERDPAHLVAAALG